MLELVVAHVELGKGRHTTTGLHPRRLPGGALLIDTPGMRELQLGDHDAGRSELRSEVDAIACRCRFADCCKEDLGEALREEERWKRIDTQARQHMRRERWGEEDR